MDFYTTLNTAVAQSGDVDAVDIEIFSGDHIVERNISAIHAEAKWLSDLITTSTRPQIRLIFSIVYEKCKIWVQIFLKIAVMPCNPADVITLLDATQEMYNKYADRPIITMSMSSGVLSRLCGEYFGSAMTFGTIGQSSAPGQIPVEQLNTVIQIFHHALIPQA